MARIVNRSALVAGIERYRHLNPIAGPEADARAMHALWSGPGQMRTRWLRGHDLTTAELGAVFEEFLSGLGAEDGAVVFFAGHGQLDADGHLRLMPGDARRTTQGVPVSRIFEWGAKAGALVVVLDCCNAGAIPAMALTLGDAGTRLVLCASTAGRPAYTDGDHGALTGALLDAARGAEKRSALDLLKAADAGCRQRHQAPVLLTRGGAEFDLVLAPSTEGPDADPPTLDPAALYRRALCADHGRLLPFASFAGASPLATRQVVPLDVSRCAHAFDRAAPDGHRLGGSMTLRALLELPPLTPPNANRWAVLGDPGAGKSTLARQVCVELAEDAPDDGPLPILMSIDRLLTEGGDPLAVATAAIGEAHRAAVIREFDQRAARPGGLWLLLDGLDEVPRGRVEAAVSRLETLAAEFPHVTLVVLSRPVGYPEGALDSLFSPVRVQALDDSQQRALLEAWLAPAGAEAVLRRIHAQRRLVELARNPLMLTLLARLALPAFDAGETELTGELPDSRAELYARTLDLLLERGHGPESTDGVKDASVARPLLEAVSLTLTEAGGENWHRPALEDAIWDARKADERLDFQFERTWASVPKALADIGQNSGVIAAHDGPAERWRYLHRSLKERLAADALAKRGPAALEAVTTRLIERAAAEEKEQEQEQKREGLDALGQWGETLGMACAALDDPLPVLERLRQGSPRLAVRVLLDAEAIPLEQALPFLWSIDPLDGVRDDREPWWDGDALLALVIGRRGAAERLWARVTPQRSVLELAWLHYALDALEDGVERARFFGACGRWTDGGPPTPDLVPIPAGTFEMGASGAELRTLPANWNLDAVARQERLHEVTLTRPYGLGRCPVTVAEYRWLVPEHPERTPGNHPVASVTWWEARLYAAWAGCALPTEAQWEHACRGRTQTKYWSGDSEAGLARVGWYDENSIRRTHRVAEKPANPFGLHDMHGNVLEWCADWYDAYPPGPTEDPLGSPAGEHRVLRGGSYWDHADLCRSAFRDWTRPGNRLHFIGFRLARPAPAP